MESIFQSQSFITWSPSGSGHSTPVTSSPVGSGWKTGGGGGRAGTGAGAACWAAATGAAAAGRARTKPLPRPLFGDCQSWKWMICVSSSPGRPLLGDSWHIFKSSWTPSQNLQDIQIRIALVLQKKKSKKTFSTPTLRRPPRPKLVSSWKVDCQEMNNFFGANPFNNGGGPVLNLCWIFYLNVFKKVPFIDMPCIGAAIIIITIRKDCSICVMPKRSSFFRNTFQRKILQGKRTQVDAHLGNDWADEEENNNQPHVD